MTKKKKHPAKHLKKKEWSEKIANQTKASPELVDWKLCADAVDDLYLWISELCMENYQLKQLINRTITKIKEDNENTKEILRSLGPEHNDIITEPED